MADTKLFQQNSYIGGISQGSRGGYEGAYQDGIGINYRDDPDKLTALHPLKKDSGSTVTDMPKWMKPYKTDVWSYGDTGKLYKRTSAGAYSNPKTVSSSTGQGFDFFNSALWYMSTIGIGKATNPDTSPTFTDDYFVTPVYENPDAGTITAANAYTPPVAIAETSANKFTWTVSVSNIIGFTVTINARGTGNWTFTIHDASNVLMGALTIANADLPSTVAATRINFPGQINVTAGQTYHLHITSTVADGSIKVGTANDLSTGEISPYQNLSNADVDLNVNPGAGTVVVLQSPLAYEYTATTALSESTLDRCVFTPNKSTIAAISLLMSVKGAGNLTLVVHDSLNAQVGTVTVSNANLKTRGVWVKFAFSTALRVTPGAEYHFHVYSNTGSAVKIIGTTANDDLRSAYYKTHFLVLNSDSDYHATAVFLNKLCIGNGNNLATIDDSEVYDPEALTFPEDERVRCVEAIGDNLAISTWKGTSIGDAGTSRIYLWDGVSPTFNQFLDVDGQVNALLNGGNNTLYIWHGTQGNMSVYQGSITHLRYLKNIGAGKTIEIYPGAVSTWDRLVMFGISAGTSTAYDRVVHSYGSKNKDFANTLSKDYPISTGNMGSGVTISAVLGISSTLFFVAWKDTTSGTSYGIDIIDTTVDQPSVFFTVRRIDGSAPMQYKKSSTVAIRNSPILATQKITLAYRLNNTGSYTNLPDGTLDGTSALDLSCIYKSFPIDKFWFEIEWKVTMTTQGGGTVQPEFYGVAMNYNIKDEFQIGRK